MRELSEMKEAVTKVIDTLTEEDFQCSVTSVEVPITFPETVGSPGANHEERSQRYAVISANNKEKSH